MSDGFRIEKDSLGEVRVPHGALFGAQTQRALENFPVSGQRFSRRFIQALGLVKESAALTNGELRRLDQARAGAIAAASREVAEGRWDDEFPLDIYQTGSGTSTNMNANEVIARRAEQLLWAEDLSGLAAYEGMNRPAIAGLSMGGYITMACAVHSPNHARAYGFVSTWAAADDEAGQLRRAEGLATLQRDGWPALSLIHI